MNDFSNKLPIELYYWPTSNGFKISIFLEEAKYPYNLNYVNISKGDKFSEKNLAIKRPGNGVSPMKWDEIIGTDATKDYNKDELI